VVFVLFVIDVVVTLLGMFGVYPGLAHFDEAVKHSG
jgi:hypothetical protein